MDISTLRTRAGMFFQTLVFFTIRPLDPADSPRKLHYTHSPGEQQILKLNCFQFLTPKRNKISIFIQWQ